MEAALGTPSEGRIKPLHHSPELTIIQVVWTPGLVAWPHDHRMWAVIGLYGGREDNTFYRRVPEGLAMVGDRRLDSGDVAVLGRDVIHSVENPLRQFTGAIGRRDKSAPTAWSARGKPSPRPTSVGAPRAPGMGRPARGWIDPRCHGGPGSIKSVSCGSG